MKSTVTRNGAAGFVLFLILLACLPLDLARGAEEKHLLILHSYHPEYGWTRDVDRGMRSVLENAVPSAVTRTEYLDSKHFPGRGQWEILTELYAGKFANREFDLILASDDAALEFLLSRRDLLFPVCRWYSAVSTITIPE